jgi:subtilisin
LAATISVGAIDKNRAIARFSRGARQADCYAPGVQIVSTWPGGRYRSLDGSSMATAHVSGVLALMVALRPTMTSEQIVRLIKQHSRGQSLDAVQIMSNMKN